jgi:hypothetical protein
VIITLPKYTTKNNFKKAKVGQLSGRASPFSPPESRIVYKRFQNPIFRLGLPFLGAIIAPLKISILRLTPAIGEIFLTLRSNGSDSKNAKIALRRGF